jgi:hypothetical protein
VIKNSELLENGFVIARFPMAIEVLDHLQKRNWTELDQYFLNISKEDGILRNFLNDFLDYNTLEHIISIRTAPDDENGIWHDDGSRFLGFSLSLNLNHESIEGGDLIFRKKSSTEAHVFSPRPYGTIILFLSGLSGYEHMVSAVTKGERIVIAGWCS